MRKSIAVGVGAATALLVVAGGGPSQAAPAPSNSLLRQAIQMTWDDMPARHQTAICRGFWINQRITVNTIARPIIQGGTAPAWQIKPILRVFLAKVC